MSNEEHTSTLIISAPNFPPTVLGGGPIQSLLALVESTPSDYSTRVLTRTGVGHDWDVAQLPERQWNTRHGAQVKYLPNQVPLEWLRESRERNYDVVYCNSFFSDRWTIWPFLLFRLRILKARQFVIAPRGEFGHGALQKSPLRKKLYMWLFKRIGGANRVIWHATTPIEAEDIRRAMGNPTRIIVRRNEVSLGMQAIPAHMRTPERRLTFASRIVPHKGLKVFLAALLEVGEAAGKVLVRIAGHPENRAYYEECMQISAEMPHNIEVEFLGPLSTGQVLELLEDTDTFILPTAGENFGHAIAEALSRSCVVLSTPLTPWTEALTRSGCVVESRDVTEWTSALRDILAWSPEVLENARKKAGEEYERWRHTPGEPHLFDLIDAFSERRTTT